MQRTTASLPDSVTELCLVRLGIQVRRLGGFWYARALGKAVEAEAGKAIDAGAGLLLSERFWIGAGHFGVLQYWRGFEEMEAWTRRPPHAEWWRGAVERMRAKGDFGVYHEAYLVPRDRVESIYLNCRPAGLAAFGTAGEPVGADTNSRGRLK
ncbi:MAG: DUF4188 domain-containing protein, partial [Planctomycetia bacterium]|nr:DUF4188 domain-containing protein [Planctomycetia bacterium]